MNPLKHLSPALYARLASPALLLDGVAVPVFEHVPDNYAGHYVLLQQPTHVPAGRARGCQGWSCTALVDVITQFAAEAVSSDPVDELLDQISERLDGEPLALPTGFDCGRATFEPSLEIRETTGERVQVRRLVRYRWQVYYHAPAEPPLPGGFDYVFSGPSGAFAFTS